MQKKLNVLFLCGWYPSKILPTNGDFIQRHAEAVALKHTVSVLHIISNKSNLVKTYYTKENINGVKTYIAYVKFSKNPFIKLYLFFIAFKNLLRKINIIDVVHLNEIYPFGVFSLYLKWFYKKPYIISEHFTGYHKPQSKHLSVLRKFISRIITKNAAFVCPVSNNLRDALLDLGYTANYKRIPNVVDTKLFIPIENNQNTFTIVHVSNMINTHKNVKGILKVIKKLQSKISNFEFKLIGDNSKQYVKFAEKIGVNSTNVKFIDQIKHHKVAKEIAQSNLFILFSNYENLPCVILEAFSCGIPVISTNVGGIKEYFPEDFGKLIAVKNQDELLNQILDFHSNFVPKKSKMHQFVKDNFSKEKIVSDFEKLYFKALKINSETH